MAIRAIETTYNGYRFRSRLEARWAVFFDYMKIQYLYEHEGFHLTHKWYLPDFYFPATKTFVEVKPGLLSRDELNKCVELSMLFHKQGPDCKYSSDVVILQGDPSCHCNFIVSRHSDGSPCIKVIDLAESAIYRMPRKGEFIYVSHFEGLSAPMQFMPGDYAYGYINEDPSIEAAVESARSMRFERR